MYLHNYLNTIHSALLQFFAGATEMQRKVEVAFSATSYPSMYRNLEEEMRKVLAFLKKTFKSSDFHYLELGVYPPITHNFEVMNTFTQERHNHAQFL